MTGRKLLGRYWYLLFMHLLFSWLLVWVTVEGSRRIAAATDTLFTGGAIMLRELMPPFILLVLVGGVAAFVKSYLRSTFSIKIQTDLRNIIIKKLVKLPCSYLDEMGTGGIMNRLISDLSQIEALFGDILPEILMGIATIAAICIYLGIMDVGLLIVTVVCYPLLLWFADRFSRSLELITAKRRSIFDDLEKVFFDIIQGMLVGRSYNLYELQKNRMFQVIDNILKNEWVRTRIMAMTYVFDYLLRWLPRLICYFFALYLTVNMRMSLGDFMAYIMLLDKFVKPVGSMPTQFAGMREYMVSLRRLEEVLNQQEEFSGEGIFTSRGNQIIQLSHVSFSYQAKTEVLTDFSLSVEEGKRIAFVGSSGSGKTTIIKLLCGFYLPQRGSIYLFGHSYQEWDREALRRQISLVSQNIFLFPGTIAENIAYGKRDATKEEVIEACKKSNIHDFICQLPDSYDTQVGERGVKLSGGQKQRIAIARAILKDAPIWLFDEPTSAVDVETEQLIWKAVKRISQGRTVITVAHRLSTVIDADVIYVLKQGKIVEYGTHMELLERDGTYRSLYQKEAGARRAFFPKICDDARQHYGGKNYEVQ